MRHVMEHDEALSLNGDIDTRESLRQLEALERFADMTADDRVQAYKLIRSEDLHFVIDSVKAILLSRTPPF